MRSQQSPLLEKKEDKLSAYIKKYVVDSETVQSSATNKAFRYLLYVLAFIGLLAGLPWLNTAQLAGGSSLLLQWITMISVVIGFGMTTAWAFVELANKLTTEPLEAKEIRKKQTTIVSALQQVSCHTLGLAFTIPTIYIAYNYNTNILYVPLAGFFSYALSTVGLYTISDGIIHLVHKINTPTTENQKQVKLARLLTTNLNALKEKNTSALTKRLLIGATLLTVLFNAVSGGVITFKALNTTLVNLTLCGVLALAVVLPMGGLDFLGVKGALKAVKNFFNKSSSPLRKKHPILYYTAPTFSLIICAFSTLTDAYVIKTEVSNSILNKVALALAINMWASKTLLQTYGLTTLFHLLINHIDNQTKPDIEYKHTQDILLLSNLIKYCDPTIFSTFLINHPEIKTLLEEEDKWDEQTLVENYSRCNNLLFKPERHEHSDSMLNPIILLEEEETHGKNMPRTPTSATSLS